MNFKATTAAVATGVVAAVIALSVGSAILRKASACIQSGQLNPVASLRVLSENGFNVSAKDLSEVEELQGLGDWAGADSKARPARLRAFCPF
jgi:hypothetical protein